MKMEKKERLWRIVEDQKEELFQICSELIQIPSVEEEGIEQIVTYVCNFLDKLNIKNKVLRPVDQTPGIVAEFGSSEGPVALLNGHNDVVETGDVTKWDYDPFCGTITDTQILGRGASDMKCGVGVFLFIVKMIVEHDLRPKGKIKLHIVHDEEKGGEKGSKWLTEHGYADDVDFCIIAEPTSYDYVEVGQKGGARVKLRTYGKTEDEKTGNAINNMMKILSRIQEISRLKGPVTEREKEIIEDSKTVICGSMHRDDVGDAIDHVNVNILNIVCERNSSMIPEVCEAYLAFGVPFMITKDMIDEKLDEIIRDAGVTCDVEYLRWQNGSRTDVDSELVQSTKKNAEMITGRKMYPAYQWATSDAKYYRALGIPAIHFGPANNKGIHSYNEDVELIDVIKVAKTHFAVLEDLMGFEG